MPTQAARRDYQNGTLWWFDAPFISASPETTIVIELDDGVFFVPDKSAPDERGFDWLLKNSPDIADVLGAPVGDEFGFSVPITEERDEAGQLLQVTFELEGVQHVVSAWPEEIPEETGPPEEEPPPSEPKPPPDVPPIYSGLMPKSWHYVPLPDGFVFNLNWIYWLNRAQDGTIRARLMYPCDDTEPLPEGIAFEGDRVMVFAGENAARLWNHVQEIIARQFD